LALAVARPKKIRTQLSHSELGQKESASTQRSELKRGSNKKGDNLPEFHMYRNEISLKSIQSLEEFRRDPLWHKAEQSHAPSS
jgi:hypothetical protein